MGRLFTSNPNGLKNLNEEAEIWQITRAGVLIPGAVLVRGLSPSENLFNRYLNEWKQVPPEEWWPEYEKDFLQEMEGEEKLNCLRTLFKVLQSGKNVVLLCLCKDARYCHRRLVGDFFKQHKIEVVELNPVKSETTKPQQQTIFEMG